MKFIWCQYDGWIAARTTKAVLIKSPGGEKIWVPRSVLGQITYKGVGDRREVLPNEYIEAVQLATWFAHKNGLAEREEE